MNKTTTILLLVSILGVLSVLIVEPVFSVSADLTENSWVSKASMHVARAYLGVGVVDGKIYAIGGDTSAIIGNVDNGIGRSYLVVNTNEQYDPGTDTWTTKTSMPTARACFGAAVFHDKIYCIGGYTAEQIPYNASYGIDYKTSYTDSAANEVYDPVTDSWQTKASIPVPLCYAQANTIGDKIYVTAYLSSSVYIYDPTTDSWSNGSSAPYKINSMGAASIGNKIFAIGEDWSQYNYPDNPIVHQYIQAYDASQNSWSIIGNSNTVDSTANGIGATSGLISPQRLYFFDQNSNSTAQCPVTQIYDLKNDSWSIGAPMSLNRLCAAVAVVNDTFYVVGGRSGQWGYITMEYPSAVTEQYIPVGYGTVRPNVNLISPVNQTYNETDVPLTFVIDKPASLMEYSLDGNANVTITGNTTLTNLSNGQHNLTVYAKYDLGDFGASETVDFTIANQPFPTASIAAVSGASAVAVCLGVIYYLKKVKH